MDNSNIFNSIYSSNNIPWNCPELPFEIVKLIENGFLKPSKMLDIGCGEGFYSVEFAKKGFDVIGIDFSQVAINKAKQRLNNENYPYLNCNFFNLDVLNELGNLNLKVDFIFEWRFLNSLNINSIDKYLAQIRNKLNLSGIYISVFFNKKDCKIMVDEKDNSDVGTKLYFFNKKEIESKFNKYFKIKKYEKIKLENNFSLDFYILVA